MAEQQKQIALSTQELTKRLALVKFFQSYFRRGKNPERWAELISVIEEELRQRGAL